MNLPPYLPNFHSWFFGKITRKDAERHLKVPQAALGSFLIRESETEPGNVLYNIMAVYSSFYYTLRGGAKIFFYKNRVQKMYTLLTIIVIFQTVLFLCFFVSFGHIVTYFFYSYTFSPVFSFLFTFLLQLPVICPPPSVFFPGFSIFCYMY